MLNKQLDIKTNLMVAPVTFDVPNTSLVVGVVGLWKVGAVKFSRHPSEHASARSWL